MLSQPVATPNGTDPAGNCYRALFESMSETILCMDLDGNIVDANPAALEKFSRYHTECIGANIYALMASHPELCQLLPGREAMDREPLARGESVSFEDVQDGRILKHSVHPVFSREGKLVRLCVIDQDITPQKEVEQKFYEIQEQLEFTLETCRLGAWTLDLGNGTVQHTLQHDRIFGYDGHAADWNYARFREHIVHEDLGKVDKLFHEMQKDANGWDIELRIRRVDGRICWIRDVGGVVRDEQGEALRLLGIIQDITERKMAEMQQQEFQARMDFALEKSHVCFWSLDLDRNTVERTLEHDRIFGYEHQLPEWTVESFFKHLHPDDLEMVTNAYKYAMETMSDFSQECRIRKANGDTGWISLAGTFKFDKGAEIPHVVGIIQDITERKQAELATANLQEQLQQYQKMDMVGQLAGGIAHDFNNVLAAILCNTDMMLRNVDRSHPFHENLNSIRHSVNRSSEMVRQLLAFARKQVLSPRTLELDEELYNIRSMLRKLFRENIQLRWELDTRDVFVRIDPSHLVQIITNLCINSRDAIEGEGVITIRTGLVHSGECEEGALAAPGGADTLVRISVSDTGCGIDQDALPHVFEPFYTTKEVGKGTGLGLSVVYGIVKQNSGLIECRSRTGIGTTVNLFFPIAPQAAGAPRQAGSDAPCRKYLDLVLLVEDEPDILKIIRSILEEHGVKVLTATNAEDAIEVLRKHVEQITVVISDVMLPGINGIQMSHLMLRESPKLKFIFMSGYSAETIAQAGMLREGLNFLSKPFTIRELLEVVIPSLTPDPLRKGKSSSAVVEG